MMIFKGRVLKLGDNINTDLIISGRYKFSITDMKELSKHIFEDIDPNFPKKLIHGKTIIVAGENFGMGSSREQAPLVIKEAGVVCVVAKNFARIFYRNSFNIGLCLIEADTDKIKDGDELLINLDKQNIYNITKEINISTSSIPKIMQVILNEGGLVSHFKKYGTIKI